MRDLVQAWSSIAYRSFITAMRVYILLAVPVWISVLMLLDHLTRYR